MISDIDMEGKSKGHSEVYHQYHEKQLRNSMKNHLVASEDRKSIGVPDQVRLITMEDTGMDQKKTADIGVEFNLKKIKKITKQDVIQKLASIDFRKNSQQKHSNFESSSIHHDFLNTIKNTNNTYFPLKNINLSSNKLVINLGNNYLIDSQFVKHSNRPAQSVVRTDLDSQSSMSINLKERIKATKNLFAPKKRSDSLTESIQMSEKSITSPPVKQSTVNILIDQNIETSRSLQAINDKIAALSNC